MERGLFIAIDAPDKAGKETQVDELAKRFLLAGEDVVTIDFPAYDTPSGQAIRAILDGIHSLSPEDNPYEVQALYAINRYEQQRRIEHALMSGKVVICDRYDYSSITYGTYDGIETQWLYDIQHSLVKPDIYILLDISFEEYQRRCGNYDYLDLRESNSPMIQGVMKLYREFAQENEWLVVNGEGKVEDIAEEIYTKVMELVAEMEV